ncbi:MAG TPA: homocysteine S-methyltransferase family protein [Syntrophomonadaceae bacterium]|nr:homocysteine S-methyltransferase family protein [Syntrophomonadaceae bacterium]
MDFTTCFYRSKNMLMEGALGERLKREIHLTIDPDVALAALVYDDEGSQALLAFWNEYADVATKYHLPFLATTPTRRANKERVTNSRHSSSIIQDNVKLLKKIQEQRTTEMYVGGLMGCKGDAYQATDVLGTREAKHFHAWQAHLFLQAGVDFLYAGIMPAVSEAIGMAQAMEETGLPYIISFMIRSDGKLIDKTSIHEAIQAIDNAVTQKPICYMTNCVHPAVCYEALAQDFNNTPLVRQRFLGIQANTSPLPPEELDGCEDLRYSEATVLAEEMMLLNEVADIKIWGGCCGTDQSHMNEIARRL